MIMMLIMLILEYLCFKLHDSLIESYAKTKELKIKINALMNENSKLFEAKTNLIKENNNLKKNRVGFICKMDDLKRKLMTKLDFIKDKGRTKFVKEKNG